MPAEAQLASRPVKPSSRIVTFAPFFTNTHPIERPITPPPIISTKTAPWSQRPGLAINEFGRSATLPLLGHDGMILGQSWNNACAPLRGPRPSISSRRRAGSPCPLIGRHDLTFEPAGYGSSRRRLIRSAVVTEPPRTVLVFPRLMKRCFRKEKRDG